MSNGDTYQKISTIILRKINYFSMILLISMFTSFCALGQTEGTMSNADIDSILDATAPYRQQNRHLKLSHYKNLLKKCQEKKYIKGIINSFWNLGLYYDFIDKQTDSALYYHDQAILLMEKNGVEKKRLTQTYTQKAITLSEAGMEFLSLESFEKAYEVALEIDNASSILYGLLNLAETQRLLGNYQKSIDLATELLDDFPVLKDEKVKGLEEKAKSILNGMIGACLVKINKPKKALSFLKVSDSIFRIRSGMDEAILVDTRTWMAHAHLDLGDPQKAIQVCENIYSEFPDYSRNLQLTDLVLGKALLQNGQTQRALQVLEQGLTSTGKKADQINILETLGFFHLSQKNFGKAEPLLNKAIGMRDSIQFARAKRFSRYSSISYDLLETQYKNDALSHKNEVLEARAKQREYIVGLLILSVAILLLLIVGYILWKKYHSGKKTIQSLKANEKAILEAHIKLREDELGVTMAHLNKSMETLKSISGELGKSIRNKDYSALENIKRALKEHQEASSATTLLTDRVESQYPRMTTQLREMYPNFTPNDVKHCVMIKLGLSLKETAQLFNITVAAVKSARGRMRKKMGLDRDVSLRQHLSYVAKSA